jgi:DNA-binding GntR family transcriptional regulator
MTVDHEGDEYVYAQLASILRDRIRSGDLPPGRALPRHACCLGNTTSRSVP